MLIKPIEHRGPRHVLDEDPHIDNSVPVFSGGDVLASSDKPVLVVPTTLRTLTEVLAGKTVDTIALEYSPIKPSTTEDGEYDEDEQLYHAILTKAQSPVKIPVVDHGKFLSITVPTLKNPIEYSVIGRWAFSLKDTNFVCVSPCSLTGTTVAYLGEPIPDVPQMQPPSSVTGIAAAISQHITNARILAVNAEGQPGFERVDPDALVDAGYLLPRILPLGEAYPSKVATAVRKVTDSMYI
ncbi:hypothetical protein DICA1_F30724 [Diutina catenulata]